MKQEDLNVESFEEAMAELEAVVKALEKADLPLDDALTAFQRGVSLSRYCKVQLTEAEATVARIMQADGREELLDGEG